jgi:hypothetical protein
MKPEHETVLAWPGRDEGRDSVVTEVIMLKSGEMGLLTFEVSKTGAKDHSVFHIHSAVMAIKVPRQPYHMTSPLVRS